MKVYVLAKPNQKDSAATEGVESWEILHILLSSYTFSTNPFL